MKSVKSVAESICLLVLASAGVTLPAPALLMPFPQLDAREFHNPFSFLVYGDIQDNYRDGHRKLVERMEKESADFILNVGDIAPDAGADYGKHFYPEIHDLGARLPFFPAIGNHDVNWHDQSSRYPFRSFFRNAFEWLDEQPENRHLAPDNQRLWYSFRHATGLFIHLDSNLFIDTGRYGKTHALAPYRNYAPEQLTWVEKVLDDAERDPAIQTKFVFLHHSPFFSKENTGFMGIGGHEDDRKLMVNQEMPAGSTVKYLLDLFRLHQVTAVFSGHEHYYEHWREDIREETRPIHSIHWVLVGSGGVEPRDHHEYGHEEVDELLEEGELYDRYLDRISELNPRWTADMQRVYPNKDNRSGEMQSYTLVNVDETEVAFRTVDVSGQVRDSGFLSSLW
ncbi:MAG: metallophosphoesterase family protein [Acidobacteriota bacterium]